MDLINSLRLNLLAFFSEGTLKLKKYYASILKRHRTVLATVRILDSLQRTGLLKLHWGR